MTDDMLTDTLRSATELYAAHGLTLDIPTARRMFNEEAGELQEAATKLRSLYAITEDETTRFIPDFVTDCITPTRRDVATEAADVWYTLVGVLAACGISQHEFVAAVAGKVVKNDSKRPENGYVALNGKIQKSVATSAAPTDDAISKLVDEATALHARFLAIDDEDTLAWEEKRVNDRSRLAVEAIDVNNKLAELAPQLADMLAALDAEREAARERVARVRQALDDLEQTADETAASTQEMLYAGGLNSPEALPDALILMGRATGTKGTVQHIRQVLDAPVRALEGDDDERP